MTEIRATMAKDWSGYGTVTGQIMVCHNSDIVKSHGTWLENNPMQRSFPTILVQMVLVFYASRFVFFLLSHLRQTPIMAQIVTGIILGPTFLGPSHQVSSILFPVASRPIIRTFVEFCVAIHMFLLGVQINVSVIRNISKRAVIISLCSLFVPFACGQATVTFLTERGVRMEPAVPDILAINSVTSFIVVTSLLRDLKILNSELGRLAASASLFTEGFCWAFFFFMNQLVKPIKFSQFRPWVVVVVTFGYLYLLFFVLSPLIKRIIRHSPDGKSLTENQYYSVLIIVLVVAFTGECIGLHAGLTTFIFGFSLPDGPPLGTYMVKRFGTITSGFVLPVYYAVSGGLRVNLRMISLTPRIYLAVILAGYLGKFIATFLSSLFLELPFLEASILGFIMCAKGIMDITFYIQWMDRKIISQELFSLLVVIMLLVAGTVTALIALLYDPSRRYMAIIRRSVLDTHHTFDFRTLVCVYSEDNVSPIINLLESLNPTRSKPVTVFVLQLMELTGRAAATFEAHHKPRHVESSLQYSDRIVNAFNQMERHSRGNIKVQHFTGVAPFASMHDDICTLALDEKANIVIVPFHKKWGIHGEVEVSCPQNEIVNQNVIEKSPCSVGVLIDRSSLHKQKIISEGEVHTSYHIVMLFLGGPDDIEALALATLMAEQHNIDLTVIRISSTDDGFDSHNELIKFAHTSAVANKILFKEELVADGEETIQVIRRIQDICDLVIVGRQQPTSCAAVSGLMAWSECLKLGALGDVFVTSDFPFSVLVVQQQPHSQEELDVEMS